MPTTEHARTATAPRVANGARKGPRLLPTRNDIPVDVRGKMVDLLNACLADGLDLQMQLKQAHWNVRGPDFIQLHELFDKLYGNVVRHNDTIAERIAALGGTAEGTVRVVAERSRLADYPLTVQAGREHVAKVADAVAAFCGKVRGAIDQADEAQDADTTDLFTSVSRALDQDLWFVEAHETAQT
ncbi:MAG: DNA starvation/stationary phase protection protein Dps [Rhodospirillales bacterium]|nr:MAG: DNA starvation/stationary phase protection protein Dps [Rhodospirillales bacterium]